MERADPTAIAEAKPVDGSTVVAFGVGGGPYP